MGLSVAQRLAAFSPISYDTISALGKSGVHVLASGRTATVVTDEKLAVGDRVVIAKDRGGWLWILGARK